MYDSDCKQKPFVFGKNMAVNSHKFHTCQVTKFIVTDHANVIFTASSIPILHLKNIIVH